MRAEGRLRLRRRPPPPPPAGRPGRGRLSAAGPPDNFVRVWGAQSRTAEGKGRGGDTWWMPVAGQGLGEDVTNGAGARPVVAAREARARRRESERRERFGNRGRRYVL